MGGTPASVDLLREHFAEYGQEHVFRFWERLDPEQHRELALQAARLDLNTLMGAFTRASASSPPTKGRSALEPAPVIKLPESGGDSDAWSSATVRGEEALAAGRVGVLVVAGGQGTRLGFPGPKGSYPIGPVSKRSLFEIQAQKIRRLRRKYGVAMPWYVMTSPATDAATREFFEKNSFFGLPASDVFFFVQGTSPAIDFEGKLILETPSRIFESPDGHGGSLTALLGSGALDDMQSRGIETIFYYQVDNPLIRMADPSYVGFHIDANAEVSSKVVRKRNAAEKMGVVAEIDGRLGIVEYTELDDVLAEATDASGELLYWAGNIAVHLFQVPFVRRVAAEAEAHLPLHPSKKKIPFVDDSGTSIAPNAPNGYKLERFVFDALPHAKGNCVVEARRSEEFSPVKNAAGEDSPESTRRDLMAEYSRWFVSAGVELPANMACSFEVDHSRIDCAEDISENGIRTTDDARDAIVTVVGEKK